jgi:triosephosphate isomerase
MRTPFVGGNWKMNTTKAVAQALARSVAAALPAKVDVGVAPPFVYLDAVAAAISGTPLLLGAQDVYFEKSGAFTGEISLDMLKDLDVKFCLSGHSERRHVIGESTDLIAKKAQAIYAAGLIHVHCVGETLDERKTDQTLAVVRRHLDELSDDMQDASRLVIAYEPVWAIGTGHNATDAQAQEIHAFIRQELAHRYNADFAGRVRVIYGGSMKPDNAAALMRQRDVDGGLIGGAALKSETFLPIAQAAAAREQ